MKEQNIFKIYSDNRFTENILESNRRKSYIDFLLCWGEDGGYWAYTTLDCQEALHLEELREPYVFFRGSLAGYSKSM